MFAELFNYKGEQYALSMGLDVTERRQTAETLKNSEEKYRAIADFTYDWETWTDTDGRYIYVSPSCRRITGYSEEEFINDPSLLIRIVHPDDRLIIERHQKDIFSGNISDHFLTVRILTWNGEERWIEHICQRIHNHGGICLGVRASNRDITEYIKIEKEKELLQSELFQSQKMESLGRLVSGVAHEINNPLDIITGNAPLLIQIRKDILPLLEKHDKDGTRDKYGGIYI